MTKFEHCIFCRECKVYMELGAYNYEAGYFDGPYIYMTMERTGSDWALRRFLETHGSHSVGFASDHEINNVLIAGFKQILPADAFCMKFEFEPEKEAYAFKKFSKEFGKVLFIVDVYDWAWDITSRELLKFLPTVDGTIVDLEDFRKMDFHPEDWDMVLVYPWIHPDVMNLLDPRNTVVCVAGGDQTDTRREFNINCGRFMVYGANNKIIRKTLQKLYPQKRIVTLSHGVDTEKFKPNPIKHDEFTILWVGSINRKSKRLWLAEQIVSEIGGKLKIAGRGSEDVYIPHDKMPEYYNSGDVLLITSMYEAHPLIAYEAMSCGIPIVSTNVGDLEESIRNGENGFIFDIGEEEKGLLVALKLLKEDRELRKTIGEEARRTILQKWRWETIVNQYRSLGKIPPSKRGLPKISVITAVKNRVSTIRRCLDSVLHEDYPNLEMIVVDGASNDGTLEVLKEYEKTHDFIHIISEADKSQGEARNKGLEIATGDFVTFLDSDDEQINGKLNVFSEFLANCDKYFAVFGNTVFRNPRGKVTENNRKSIPNEISFKTLNKANYIGSGAIMLRNSPEVRFDEDKRFGEDHTLWMNLVAKYPIAYLDFDAYYWTQGDPDGIGENTPDWREIVKRNKEEARVTYSGSPHKERMRVAIFCEPYGLHPSGGPAIYGYNVVEMLHRSRVDYVMFHTPLLREYPHPDYCKRSEFIHPRPEEIEIDDFNIFYVMNSINAIQTLNRGNVLPIIGSNHITNSAPTHCLKYFTDRQRGSREKRVRFEEGFIRKYKGKFWLAQSLFQMGEYQRIGMNLTRTPVYLAPNPIDTDLFKRRKDVGDTIIWSGKNNWAKGVPFLEKVCHKLSSQEIICLWAGEGGDFPLMPRNTMMTTGNTLFHIPKYLEQGKVFLSTSLTENQPCAALEAMAMNLPVVGFRVSGMPEIVREGETGFLVELGDVDGMIEKIEVLLNDESLREEMGRNARRFVVDRFSYYSALDAYLTHFKRYLEN